MKERGYLVSMVTVVVLLSTVLVTSLIEKKKEKKIEFDDAAITEIKRDVARINNFVGIIIVSADVQSNSRKVVYYHFTDPVVREAHDNFFANKAIATKEPLFLKGTEDKAINDRLIKLINHEFTCTPYSSIIGSRFIPEVSARVSTVCGNAVPPSFGEFDGMVNIYLSKEPTTDEKILLKVILADISDDISKYMKNP